MCTFLQVCGVQIRFVGLSNKRIFVTVDESDKGDTFGIYIYIYIYTYIHIYGLGSSVGIATDYGLDGPGSNPGGDEIFLPSRQALGPPNLL